MQNRKVITVKVQYKRSIKRDKQIDMQPDRLIDLTVNGYCDMIKAKQELNKLFQKKGN